MTANRPLTLESPTRTVNFAKILPLFRPTSERGIASGRRRAVHLQVIDSSRKRFAGLAPAPVPAPTAMKLIETEEFSIPKVTGVLSRAAGISELSATGSAHMRLPLGMPRFVNVATLKRMLKAKRTETMLRRVGDQWEVCEDATQVDLLDDSVEFRLGAVQIFS